MSSSGSVHHKSSKQWTIEGLPAHGPASDLRDKLRLFGQFIGSWDIIEHRSPLTRLHAEGEVHFNWILDGRAVQDVWGSVDSKTGRLIPWGTTIRYYDSNLGAWRSTWIAPRQKAVRRFIGRKVGHEIVLREEDRGTRTERWIFSDIRPNSFRWYALKRPRAGGPWRKVEEMKIRRRVNHRAKRPAAKRRLRHARARR
jgi:hypothetical protein